MRIQIVLRQSRGKHFHYSNKTHVKVKERRVKKAYSGQIVRVGVSYLKA